jgi:hypothetical protein
MPAEPSGFETRLLPVRPLLDRFGAAGSLLCAAHCVIAPLAVAVLPLAGLQLALGESLEWTFVVAGLVLGSLSLVPSFRRLHRRHLPLLLFLFGALLWLTARAGLAPAAGVERAVMIAGSLAVVAAHVVNRRLCRACHTCADHE